MVIAVLEKRVFANNKTKVDEIMTDSKKVCFFCSHFYHYDPDTDMCDLFQDEVHTFDDACSCFHDCSVDEEGKQ